MIMHADHKTVNVRCCSVMETKLQKVMKLLQISKRIRAIIVTQSNVPFKHRTIVCHFFFACLLLVCKTLL